MNIQNMREKIAHIITSSRYKTLAYAIGVVLVIALILQIGIGIGIHKGATMCGWGKHYEKNFGHMQSGFREHKMPNGHGAVGRIVSSEGMNLVVEEPNLLERTIALSPETTITKQRNRIGREELVPEMYIAVLGETDESGVVNAKFIRVLPEPPKAMGNMPSGMIMPMQDMHK